MPEIKIKNMVLSDKEKAVAVISNAIAAYSLFTEKNSLPENTSLIDFILKATPKELKPMISMDLIDEIFEYISKTRMDDS